MGALTAVVSDITMALAEDDTLGIPRVFLYREFRFMIQGSLKGEHMKRLIVSIAIVILMTFSFSSLAFAGDGPAPNSGDGISDGSGLLKGRDLDDKGAPNSGDGISDGSGW